MMGFILKWLFRLDGAILIGCILKQVLRWGCEPQTEDKIRKIVIVISVILLIIGVAKGYIF